MMVGLNHGPLSRLTISINAQLAQLSSSVFSMTQLSGCLHGPILNLAGDSIDLGSGGSKTKAEITEWLDDQSPSSVVFLCFGSMGSFDEDQVKEIACALKQSGHRFLWSLRQPPPKGQFAIQGDYTNPTDVLPKEFLDRTVKIEKVIGWTPQVPKES
ncbi:anthocyanidin 3-O-glucosyltransferase 6-like [Pistacia vera]|uniref:anthocyanidin 3-O-glucosyltransferase 6-like n=1 Tax=Pistacia vera TaxID=55513 RepID=UPI001263DF81|nr:anthocyanidin 3-O-glucosyltransferase 6-like [Pistacia vera]